QAPGALMPVVFTSMLVVEGERQGQGREREEAGVAEESGGSGLVYAISQTPQVWLDHQAFESGGGLRFNWDAVEDLFPPGLLDEMFAAYQRVLAALLEESGWQETGRPWLPALQLLRRAEVNSTEAPVASGLLHGPFEAWAALRPEAVAVIAGGGSLSYGELDRRANRLAYRLRELGARPNRLVAVVMEKGWEQVVAVLGILKSGAAYLPVDPSLPRERRWYLLEHGEVAVALTQPWLAGQLDWPEGIVRLEIEEGQDGAPAPVLPVVQGSEDLAYVIFTSGSTGQPKGVMIDHRGALNTVVDVNRRFGVGPRDRVLALSSLSFDLSVYDIFGLLAAGGAIVLPEPSARRDPERWLELLAAHGVTVWNS